MRHTWLGITVALAVVTGVGPSPAKSIYLIGNSLTDNVDYEGFEQLAVSRGLTQPWGRSMTPGAPLLYMWQQGSAGFCEEPYGCFMEALANHQWDVLTLQPFDWTAAEESDAIRNYCQRAQSRSPNLQSYVYAQWPLPEDWPGAWTATYDGGWSNLRSGSYYEQTFELAKTKVTGIGMPSPLFIPVGHVLYEIYRRMQAGTFTAETRISSLYAGAGDIHLNNKGEYVAGCTFFAVIYRSDPHGLPGAPYSVNATYAAQVHDAIWAVITDPAMAVKTGVTGVKTVPPAKLSAPLRKTRTGQLAQLMCSLSGRCVALPGQQRVTAPHRLAPVIVNSGDGPRVQTAK